MKLGIGDNFYKVVKHMYSNSKFTVKKDNFLSSIGKYEKGVKEGDGLSTLLLNVYINNMNNIFDASILDPIALTPQDTNALFFTDDLVLLSESKEGLQSCLDSMQMYCDSWKLEINVDKTKVIILVMVK